MRIAPDPAPNASKNKAVTIADVIAVVSYIGTFTGDAASPPNANGVRYDSLKAGDWFIPPPDSWEPMAPLGRTTRWAGI